MKLYEHQQNALNQTNSLNHVAYYHDMGLGKTFTGAEKMMQLGAKVNLVICQKSKIDDWAEHFKTNYSQVDDIYCYDLTNKRDFECFFEEVDHLVKDDLMGLIPIVGVINYELAFKRPKLAELEDFTLMLDESSLIQNENSKRSKFILKKLQPKNVILLSGTPTGGKYELLWSQLHLLGWSISKELYWRQYVDFHYDDNEGYSIRIIDGYKNVDRLKKKMRQYGCNFLKTEEVFDLPEQIHQTIKVQTTKEYRKFRKDCIISWEETFPPCDDIRYIELVGDTTLTKMLYERQLCGQYNQEKLATFMDLLESTDDRLIVFYNFTEELNALWKMTDEIHRLVSVVNGQIKQLDHYEKYDNSVTFIQYQAGAMGLNLQKANKIVYFSPPLSSELFEQSKKRIHRIGQEKPCFYYYMTCQNSIEEKIYDTLSMRKDFTDKLFEEGD